MKMIERTNPLRDVIVLLIVIVSHALFLAFFILHSNKEAEKEKIELLQAELIPPAKVMKEPPPPKEPPKPAEKAPPTPKILSIAPEKAKPVSPPSSEPVNDTPQKKTMTEQAPDANASSQDTKIVAPVSKTIQTPGASDLGVEGGSVKLTQLKMVYKPDTNVFYPRISKDIGEQGVVSVILFIDESGSVTKTQITQSSGYKRLDKAAEELCIRIRFLPYLVDGNPTKVSAGITIKFEMTR